MHTDEYSIQKFWGRRRSTTKVSTGQSCARGTTTAMMKTSEGFWTVFATTTAAAVRARPALNIYTLPPAVLRHYVDIIQSRKPPGAAETINE